MMNRSRLFVSVIAAACAFGISAAARAALIHRYSFNDAAASGGIVKDSIGSVDGKLKGSGATVADGKLELKNENKNSDDTDVAYVDFSASILPKGVTSASIAVWFSASDVGTYSRVFNIGDKEGSEGRAFIYFTPRNTDDASRAAITATDAASKTFQDNDRLDDGKPHMVALVIDGAAKKLHVFIDGKEPKPAEDLGDNTLDKVRAVHSWLGRSSFDQDPGLTGSIDEVRVYDHPLTADEAAAAFKAGADQLPASPASTTHPSGGGH